MTLSEEILLKAFKEYFSYTVEDESLEEDKKDQVFLGQIEL